MMTPQEQKLLTPLEAAEVLGIKEDEVTLLAHSGYIPYYRIGGAYLRFKKEQLEASRDEIRAKLPALHSPDAYKEARQPSSRRAGAEEAAGVLESIGDFWYFNDFYIISGAVIIVILFFIVTRIL